MALRFSALRCSSRLITHARTQIMKLKAPKRLPAHPWSVQRRHTSDAVNSLTDQLTPGTEKYKYLQRYFVRRLRATYHQLPNIPDHSAVCGLQHVYLVRDDGIYRLHQRECEPEPEKVLNLEQPWAGEESPWIIQRIRLSPREKHLAATLKRLHSEELRCVIVRLGDGKSSHHIILTVEKVFSFEWATDDVLFYTTLEGLRSSSAFRLDLTADRKTTRLFEETQPDVFVEVALSRDKCILTINCSSRSSSEVLMVDVTRPCLEPSVVQPRQPDLLYHVEHWRGSLITLANTGPGREYQVVQSPVLEPSLASWVSLYTPGPGTVIKDMDVVGDHCVLVAKTPTSKLALIVISLIDTKEKHIIELPSWACSFESKRPGFTEGHDIFEFLLSSPVHAPEPYALCTKEGQLWAGTEVHTHTEHQDKYITRLEAPSQDGTMVPVTLFHSVPVSALSRAPLLIHVYGAYGQDLSMGFSPVKSLMLEQGWALAYCHVRGGGERGLSWHRRGRLEGKPRAAEDLRACLHRLCSLGVSSPSLTALAACSAGAVPVGALCNTRPNMMQAAVLQAPFLDVLGTLEDPSMALEDRDEWGDPIRNQKHRNIICSYCPVHNITPQSYPSMLLTAYSDDPRVPLQGVLKYTDRIRKATQTHFRGKPGRQPNIVLNIQPAGNHQGPEYFEPMLEEEALQLAFLYTELGLDPPQLRRKRRKQSNLLQPKS